MDHPQLLEIIHVLQYEHVNEPVPSSEFKKVIEVNIPRSPVSIFIRLVWFGHWKNKILKSCVYVYAFFGDPFEPWKRKGDITKDDYIRKDISLKFIIQKSCFIILDCQSIRYNLYLSDPLIDNIIRWTNVLKFVIYSKNNIY